MLLVGGAFLVFVGARMIHERHPNLNADVPTLNDQLRRWHVWGAALTTGFVLTIIAQPL